MVGCVGRIKLVRKGQEVLLRAAAILKKRGVMAKYVIVGAPFPSNEANLEVLQEINPHPPPVRLNGSSGAFSRKQIPSNDLASLAT